ncbi:unnamed protein product [Prorocentrum cordatum]|uniref:Uncharacterized protein n=1 Tax=Prorocentrum cordatum TaxID=2364126 RepID=A0ABN9QVV1_9DINO|nr:unnamed protein product [Polarella glacialis]
MQVPVPFRLGQPILYKKLSGTGGDDSQIKSSSIVRFMADPDDGFAPLEWQYGGRQGPAPPVVLARRDRVPFSKQVPRDLQAVRIRWGRSRQTSILHARARGWHGCGYSYILQWLDEIGEEEDDRTSVSDRLLTPAAFQSYVEAQREECPTAFLSVRFPLCSTVVPHGLGAGELNGLEGEVAQYGRDRVGVRFEGRGVVALRPERLTVVRGLDTGESKAAREADLQRQEMQQISRRFIECLYQDTFPEMGGAVKCGDVSEEEMVEALLSGKQQEYFEGIARKLAAKREPNSSYAQRLLGELRQEERALAEVLDAALFGDFPRVADQRVQLAEIEGKAKQSEMAH